MECEVFKRAALRSYGFDCFRKRGSPYFGSPKSPKSERRAEWYEVFLSLPCTMVVAMKTPASINRRWRLAGTYQTCHCHQIWNQRAPHLATLLRIKAQKIDEDLDEYNEECWPLEFNNFTQLYHYSKIYQQPTRNPSKIYLIIQKLAGHLDHGAGQLVELLLEACCLIPGSRYQYPVGLSCAIFAMIQAISRIEYVWHEIRNGAQNGSCWSLFDVCHQSTFFSIHSGRIFNERKSSRRLPTKIQLGRELRRLQAIHSAVPMPWSSQFQWIIIIIIIILWGW